MAVLNDRERGMVTAEMAVSLLGLTVVTAALIGAVAMAGTQVRCAEAARAGARAAARGDAPSSIEGASRAVLPGSFVLVTRGGDQVRVRVTAGRAMTGPLFAWLPTSVSAEAVAQTESP